MCTTPNNNNETVLFNVEHFFFYIQKRFSIRIDDGRPCQTIEFLWGMLAYWLAGWLCVVVMVRLRKRHFYELMSGEPCARKW